MSSADDFVGIVRRNGRRVTLEHVIVPPHDPTNPGDPVPVDYPGVYALDQAGDTRLIGDAVLVRTPSYIVAAKDPALPDRPIDSVARVRDGDGRVVEVNRVRPRRVRGELIALVLEAAG